MRPSLRLATSDDLAAYSGAGMPDWCAEWTGWAAERHGRVIGLGLVCWDRFGQVSGWFDASEPLSPFLMHRLARKTLDHLRSIGVPRMLVYCDDRQPRAAEWLARLGFRNTGAVLPGHGAVWACDL